MKTRKEWIVDMVWTRLRWLAGRSAGWKRKTKKRESGDSLFLFNFVRYLFRKWLFDILAYVQDWRQSAFVLLNYLAGMANLSAETLQGL